MFRKIVSNLAFSPALVGQLGFYAKRLRQEEATRKLGMIFTVLALIMQSFAVIQPPESANAANSSDMINGGVTSLSQYLAHYDRNTNGIRDLYNTMGITRAEIAGTKASTINSKGSYLSWGMSPHFSAAQGEGKYIFPKSDGSTGRVYYRPLKLWDTTSYTKANGSTYKVFTGHSAKVGWFALILDCGNLVTKSVPAYPPCRDGQVGTWPNCTTPQQAPHCPAGTTGTYPHCKTTSTPTQPAPVATPFATCSALAIHQVGKVYSFTGYANTSGGASIQSYTYIVSKDGKQIDTKTVPSSSLSSTYSYTPTGPGMYTVVVSIATSLGIKSSVECTKSFTVALPEMCPQNPSLRKDSAECQPCPTDTTLWVKDEKCAAKIVETKQAVNITQGGVDATTVVAKAGDQITYTISAENIGLAPTTIQMDEHLADVLEYASLTTSGGGVYTESSKTLTWNNVSIQPKTKQSRVFVVKVNDEIPATPQGKSDRTSYDCIMTNTYGNSLGIPVDCPAPKQVEQVVAQLPQTGATENMIFGGIVFALVTYFYARSRQIKREIRLIRRDLNTGTI